VARLLREQDAPVDDLHQIRNTADPHIQRRGAVSLGNMPQHFDVQLLPGHDLLELPVLLFPLLQLFGLLGLHPPILLPPTQVSRFTHLQGLQHGRLILASIEHRIRIPQLPNNLLRRMPLPPSRCHLPVSFRPSWALRPSYQVDRFFKGRPAANRADVDSSSDFCAEGPCCQSGFVSLIQPKQEWTVSRTKSVRPGPAGRRCCRPF
jgi:hypothetical protein